jgi:flavin-dependent dehydrogenase
VEQVGFPRYHIGESMTGAGGQVVRDLGFEAEMIKRKHPQKKGVTVLGPKGHTSWFVPVMGRDENWQLFEWLTWQVRRSEFDAMLLGEAQVRGATLLPGKALAPPLLGPDGSVRGARIKMDDGGTLDIESEVVLDCSGMATWLANAGITGPKYRGNYDKQIAIFSHVHGAIRDESDSRRTDKDNTLIFYKDKFHWAWFIPIDAETVSVGVVIPTAYFQDKKESRKDFLLREMRELHADLSRRMVDARLADAVHVIPNYSYQVRGFCGRGFICIGDAHRFIDPIFSFGLTVSMREAQFMAPVVKAYLEGANRDAENPFADYQRFCEKGIDILEDTIDFFWEKPLAFAYSVHQRSPEMMIDMFAGRIYAHERQPSPALMKFREVLGRERERSYETIDEYSVPIGSRYHPERAPLWEAASEIETTEEWMRA